ncbi:ABC transporter permease [Pseudonocardia sp. ICBG601]|uniref:ABC transporter permease n=1 Tax=Pseudonocardia sp. ICBG601 TaxID=2846759 RepID=UPI001CF70DE8|nr:ABC transporter permease [Pseudonocardia sp. ICBG601]
MTAYVLRRLGVSVLTLLLASVLVFVALQALPGDLATQLLGRDATPDAVAALREQLGLDRPAWERYLGWLGAALTGDLGTSLVSGDPVTADLAVHLRNTLLVAGPAVLVGIPLAVALGVFAGLYRDRAPDLVISTICLVGMSVPEFVVATVLVLLLAITVPLAPAVVLDGPTAPVADLAGAIWLPAIALTTVMAAYIVRMARAGVIDTMGSEFVTTARLKGVPRGRIVLAHVLPSALLPTLNVIAVNLAWLIGGAVVVEAVFNYPGVGTLMLRAVQNRDVPTLQAVAVLGAVVYVVVNLAADLAAMALDPRLRSTR